MGRHKPKHPKRESRTRRFEKKIAVRVMVAMSIHEERTAFVDAFGSVMTDAEKEHYMATGEFDASAE